MIESSVQRTPVEIWRQIIAFAVHSPLLPGWNDGILEAMAVLSSGCKADKVARSAHDRVETVRLVCRSWDAAVKDICSPVLVAAVASSLSKEPPPHVVVSPSAKVLSQAGRLEVWDQSFCSCSGSSCRYSLLAELTRDMSRITDRHINSSERPRVDTPPVDTPPTGETLVDRNPPFPPTHRFKGLKVFVTPSGAPGITTETPLDFMASLEALSWDFPGSAPQFHTLIEHPVHRNLTYLKVRFSWDFLKGLTTPVNFPLLHHLHLLFDETNSSSESHNLATWARLPALRSLILSGEMDRSRHEEVYLLLNSCGSTLSSLLVDIVWRSDLQKRLIFNITPRLWDCLPILSNFGPGVDALIRNPPPTNLVSLPITILLSTIPADDSINPAALSPSHCLRSFLQVCREWKTREVLLVESWKQATYSAENHMRTAMIWTFKSKETYHLSRDPELYRALLAQGITVHDSNRVPITHKDGAVFLKMLRGCKSTFKKANWIETPEGFLY